jgi:methionine-S-sulfoxide reductase
MNTQVATLAGGCFWCLEAVFEQLRGVTKIASGYAGGHVPHPSYQAVCTGTTGHAEVVQVTFDADEISFRDLSRSSSRCTIPRRSIAKAAIAVRSTARPSSITMLTSAEWPKR